MFCYKCGAPVKEGELFCSACGAKQDVAAPGGQGAQPPAQPQYGQQQYGQPYGAQPPYGQPPVQQPPKKRSKKFLWIGIAAVLVLAIAAAVVFVVLPALGGGAWPLSGSTTQTKFINDSVKVFSGAFSDLGNGTFEKLIKEPFDLSADLKSDGGGEQFTGTVEAAYDKQALGFSAESNGVTSKLLLLKDTLFTDSNGTVSGVEFGSDADMSKPMSLEDRLKALTQGLSGNAGTAAKLDYKKLAEMLVNSISADCFESSGGTTTLTLAPADIVDTLKTFTDKLGNDKALKQQLEDYIKDVSGATVDVAETLGAAVQAMEATMDAVDFEIVWEVAYDNGAPASLAITVNSGEDSFKAEFGYAKEDGGKDITFALYTQDETIDVTGEISYKKAGDGITYSGSITAQGGTMSFDGSEKWSGEKTHGELKLSMEGQEMSFGYDETLKFGMPQGSVEDDARFGIDTASAQITEISSLLDYFTIANSTISQVTPGPQIAEEPAVTEDPAVTDAPTSYDIGLVVPDDQSVYSQELATAIQTELGVYGGNLTVLSSANDSSQENLQVTMLLAEGVDGILVLTVADSATMASMQSDAAAAGVPILFISDFADGTVNAVARDYETMCSVISGACTGNVYIINSMQGITFSDMLEQSFTGILATNPDITVLGSGYSNFDAEAAKTLTETALQDYSDLNTVVCLDPVSAEGVLEVLNANGFAGTFVCFTEESIMNEMTALTPGSTTVTYGYFPVSDTAYTAVSAMLELMGGGTSPQVYYLTPYTY